MAEIQVREITGTDLVPTTFRLRYEVWSAETKLLTSIQKRGLITDEHDAHARHWAAFDGDEMVAAARMCMHDSAEQSPDASAFDGSWFPVPIATINRLIVKLSHRNRGLARRLDGVRIVAAGKEGAKCVLVHTPPSRIEALRRLGFRLTGEERFQPFYSKSLVAHGMVLMLNTPAESDQKKGRSCT